MTRLHPFRAVFRLVPVIAIAACGSATEPPGPAAQLVAASDTVRAGFVGAALPDSLVVRVVDANGRGVPGHSVTWMSAAAGGTLDPRESLTDERGRARSALRLGTRAGEYTAAARAVTTEGPLTVRFRAVAAPGPTSAVRISPAGATLEPGETRQLSALRIDSYGNSITDRPVAWSSSSPGVASVDPQTGLVRALALGTTRVTAASEGRSDTVTVTVAQMTSGEDPFDSNTLGQYTQYADAPATWSIAEGILTAGGSGKQSVQIHNDVALTDGWVEAEMDRADEGGLVLRFQDARNYYLLSIHDDGSILGHRNLELFRRDAGAWRLLAYGKNIDWPRGTVRTIRFEAVGDRLRAYADGVLLVEVTDSGITAPGRVGVRYNDVPETSGTDVARYFTLRWRGK